MEEDGKMPDNDSKKPFRKLWCDEDEITILKGLPDFISKTGNDPLKYVDAFYNFVIKSLQVDANRAQLKDKVRRLKKKFETHACKGKNGESPKFPKAHDQKAFELANKVWGSGANEAAGKPPKKEANSSSKNVASSAKKAKAEARQEPPPPESDMQDVKADDTSVLLSEMSGLNEDVVKKGLELIGASKRAQLAGRWKKIQVAELELFAKRAQLVEEQTRLILEAYKSSKN
ncbi:GLABROUS1 enhancer-binding protein-like [Lotus japonicus]|uniref:GLABROUS1 enhancer-binding protein-like n=1 Tax=Lotus japonicus TaxID=34305 RepID=UPI0025844552|nr:GLABROUS1 enhancer-binding protein-like [Lotus japonicus]